MVYTYRFVDTEGEVSYVGKTTSLSARISQHFGKKGHLSKDCYKNVARIDYQKHETESDALIYEEYYICKYKTKYNKAGKSRDLPTVELTPKEWKVYKQLRPFVNDNTKMQGIKNWKLVFLVYLLILLVYYVCKWFVV